MRKEQWIKIEEGLPIDVINGESRIHISEDVLVYNGYIKCIACREYDTTTNESVWISDSLQKMIGVTHWMHLPENPS